jgi:hypothetical protein
MRVRSSSLLLSVFALVIAACSPANTTETTSTTNAPQETTTTAPAIEAPEAMVLSYTLEPGQSFTYEVSIDQQILMESTGDSTALGEDEIPGEMDISIEGTSIFTYDISAGPEPGTFSVNVTGDFSNLTFTGTVDGESVETSEIPDLADMEPVDVTVIVDEMGNVIPESNGLGEDFPFGNLGGLGMLDQMGPNAGLGQFIGPPLTEEEVTVGDTWSETVETPGMDADSAITTEIFSEVTGSSEIDGNEVFVIETTTTVSAFEFDLGELLLGFMFAFIPEDATEEELAELEAMKEQLRFAFSVDETVSNMTTWFDPEAGLARQAEFSSATSMVFDINMPDESTGELIAFGMNMSIAQDIGYRLTESAGT